MGKLRIVHNKTQIKQVKFIRDEILKGDYNEIVTLDIVEKLENSESAISVLKLLENKVISSENLVLYYLKQCVISGISNYAPCDFMTDDALEFAAVLDEERENGNIRSP